MVLLSDLQPPQVEFFHQLVGILASKCLTSEISEVLRSFYETVGTQWPEPQPLGRYDQLQVFGYMLQLEIPPEDYSK